MPRKGHSEEKIVYALRQVEGGAKVSEVGRQMGGFVVGVLQLEAAVCRIGLERVAGAPAVARGEPEAQRIVADLTLHKHILQEVLSKKV